jgi:pimeloyl-ACP methyl ester carboxylesterase
MTARSSSSGSTRQAGPREGRLATLNGGDVTALALIVLLLAIVVGGLAGFAAYTTRKVETAVPPRGRFLELDGCRIHYVDEGAGPPLFLIHGLGGQLGNFTYALIGRLANEFRVIAVDRPGSGYSTRPAGADPRLRAQAEIIAKLIKTLNLGRPLVVGHSLGGAITLALGLDHPECASGLALIAPVTQLVATPPEPFRGLDIKSPLLRWIVAWTLATPLGIRKGDQILKQVFAPDKAPADFVTLGGGALGLRPQSFCATSADLEAVNDGFDAMIRRYPTLSLPVGILFGKGDNLLDYRVHGQATKDQIPGLDLELMEGGHMLPVTAPDAVADFIRRRMAGAAATKAA